jgi:hypothetical protein
MVSPEAAELTRLGSHKAEIPLVREEARHHKYLLSLDFGLATGIYGASNGGKLLNFGSAQAGFLS